MVWQADIVFFSATDSGFSENFGLKTRISKFFDWRCCILRFATKHFKSYFRQASFFDHGLNLQCRPYSFRDVVSICEANPILRCSPHSLRLASICEAGLTNWDRAHSLNEATSIWKAYHILWCWPHSFRSAASPMYVIMMLRLTLLVQRAKIGSFLWDGLANPQNHLW